MKLKMKTNKSAAKRVRNITKNNKMIVGAMSAQHRTRGKSKGTMQKSKKTYTVSSANIKIMKKLIPYR
jgi:ribosomal protein L35